ncbi:hypothetical protein B5X24_HaOG200685 [Helicoverpa armigera]|uniref:Uncharacterized protein n=1 Tax=Helicoverpa armigera TaxID=29058 RepID=A0A2W1C143_HELAM|nr:hypothetical protein B5X24_HaOG200685 [Helicoverpa armigera]
MADSSRRLFELVFRNKLDEDTLMIIKPFNIFLRIFFSSKFKIRNGYITPRDKTYYILPFIFVSLFKVWTVYYVYIYNSSILNNTFRHIYFWHIFISYCIYYSLLVYCNIVNSQNNVVLILRIQEIFRSIHLKNGIRSYVIWNWITFVVLASLECFCTTIYARTMNLLSSLNSFDILLSICYDFNVACSIRLIKSLTLNLVEWSNTDK